MKACLLLLIALSPIPVFSENSSADGRAQILANLNRVESTYLARLSGKELQDAVRLLNETRALIAGLPAGLGGQRDQWGGSANQLNDEGLQGLIDSANKEGYDGNKNKVVMSALGSRGKITASQLRDLFKIYSDDSSKKDLLIAIHDNVVDPVNIGMVLSGFNNSYYSDQVLKAYKDQ